LIINAWYLDDGTLIGPTESIHKAYSIIIDIGPRLGLHLNPSKCILYWPTYNPAWDTFPEEIIRTTEGVKLLGSPIGTDSFTQEQVSKTVITLRPIMDAVSDINDPQIELTLLRACVGFPKIVFSLRVCPPAVTKQQINDFDDLIHEQLSRIVGSHLTHSQRQLWALPMSFGGFGIPIASDISASAFVASVIGSWQLQLSLGTPQPRKDYEITRLSLSSTLPLLENTIALNAIENPLQFSQYALRVKLSEISFKSIQSDAIANNDLRTQAILLSRSRKYANGWLHTVPSEWSGSHFEPYVFRMLLKYNSGIPLSSREMKCPCCESMMDIYGDHAISCSSTGHRIGKHNSIVRWIAEKLREANVGVHVEESVDKARPGDLVLTDWFHDQSLYVDFSVASTLCPSYIKAAAKESGKVAEIRTEDKLRKYGDLLSQIRFTPLVIETLGGWASSATPLLKGIARKLADAQLIQPSKALSNFCNALSVRLQKHNGSMLAIRHLASQSRFDSYG
jgi:hypothetical protein